MWVFEEYVKFVDGAWIRPARGSSPPEGKTWVDVGYTPLTQVINEKHENVIYLPGIELPHNIVAEPDIKKCVTGATMMVRACPPQTLRCCPPHLRAPHPWAVKWLLQLVRPLLKSPLGCYRPQQPPSCP
eukprot:scaffold13802_cov116-Isochrysis_galbana.AAC.6